MKQKRISPFLEAISKGPHPRRRQLSCAERAAHKGAGNGGVDFLRSLLGTLFGHTSGARVSNVCLLLAITAGTAGRAFGEQTPASRADLEAELFGAPQQGTDNAPASDAAPAGAAGAPAAEAERKPLPSAPSTTSRAVDALAQSTAIGGRADFSLFAARADDEPPGESAFGSHARAFVYLDSRPGQQVRGFLRTRVDANAGSTPESANTPQLRLLEAWMKGSNSAGLFWTIGKQPIRWGSGTFWNPTDFLAAETRDPLAFTDDRGGSEALELLIPFEDANASLSFLINTTDAQTMHDIQLATRAEWAFGFGELAASAAYRERGPMAMGLDLSSALGPIDVRAEASCTRQSARKFYRRTSAQERSAPASGSASTTFNSDGVVVETKRAGYCRPQIVTGMSYDLGYGHSDAITFGAEYFWNDLGHDDALLELASAVEGGAKPLYLARRYAAAYLAAPSPGGLNDTTLQAIWLHNLSDGSSLGRFSVTQNILTYSRLSFGFNARRGLGEFRVNSKDVESLARSSTVAGTAAGVEDEGTRALPPSSLPTLSALAGSTPAWQADLTFSVTL